MAAVPSIGRASLLEPGAPAPEATATQDLYERHGARIHRYCLHQLGSREEAEDAVQTTFMNALGALSKGVVPESESAWLYKIAENVCLSRRRSSWRRGRIESPADFGVIEEVVASPESRHDELIGIEDALAAMPVQQRRAILLREWQGLSYREVAQELDVSQAAVETLIFRARRSLARGLTEAQVEPKHERRGLRKALHLGDLASIFIGAKALLGGTAAAHAAVAAVTVATVAGVTARPASELVPDTVKAPPVPAATKKAPVAPPTAPPPIRVVQEPRRPVAQEPTAVPVVAATKPKARPAAAKPKAPPARVAHPRAAPTRGAPPHAAAPTAPGREVSAARRAAGGKPATKPDRPDTPANSHKPTGKLAAEPKAAAKAKASKPAAAPKPSSRPPAAEPSAAEPPVSPAAKPKEKALPEAAASRAAAAHESEPPAESKHEPEHGGPPVSRGS